MVTLAQQRVGTGDRVVHVRDLNDVRVSVPTSQCSSHAVGPHRGRGDDSPQSLRCTGEHLGQPAAGDPAPRRARLPRPGRRAALPAGRLGDRRPPRHGPAGRPRASPAPRSSPRPTCSSSSPTARPASSPASSAPATSAAAVGAGIDGIWLALVLGVAHRRRWSRVVRRADLRALRRLAGRRSSRRRPTCASPPLGIPAMLVILAVTGVLRGLQDTRTPLVASVVGFGANIVLNLVLVYGAAASASPAPRSGTVLAQTGMAAALVAVVTRRARALGRAACAPHPGAGAAGGDGRRCRCWCARSPCGPCSSSRPGWPPGWATCRWPPTRWR